MSSDEKKKISAAIILEVIGRPPEHLVETLNGIVNSIKEEKGVEVRNAKINEPVELKEQKGFYSSFVEVEVAVEEILYFAILLFKYMPAHVEVISPQNINLTNSGWTDIFNEITRRLHGYEEVARIMQTEKIILERKLREILELKKEDAELGKKEEKEVKSKKGKKDKKEE
jgi:hypothetical protein